MRSASQPIMMPPRPVPTQTSAPASATTERSVPRASWIGLRPTTTSSGAPYEIERMPSVRQAATHDARLSMLAARCGITPVSGIAGISSRV